LITTQLMQLKVQLTKVKD